MPDIPHISEREWLVMTKLWEKNPQTAAEVVEKVQEDIAIGDSSVRTLINRLIKKKAVSFTVDERNANLYYYYPLVCEQDCIGKKTQHFMELYYKNSAAKMIAAFAEESEIPVDDLEQIKKLIDEKLGNQ
jgi:BlaI family penicillinase repressor